MRMAGRLEITKFCQILAAQVTALRFLIQRTYTYNTGCMMVVRGQDKKPTVVFGANVRGFSMTVMVLS